MIKGEKTILRGIESADVPLLWEWTQDEELMRFRDFPTPPVPLSEQIYERYLEQSPENIRLALCTKEGELIGETSLLNIENRSGNADFTIAIGNKEFLGKGYGSDATHALIRYAFDQLNLNRITLYVHEFNERAIHAYEKCGFKREGKFRQAHYMDGKYSDVVIMGILREDFLSLDSA